jgi:hypothetical protein
MTNLYALKYELDGSDGELILNALNQGEAIRKAEQWFARKFPNSVPAFSAKPLASIVICGNEKEIVCQPASSAPGPPSGRN